MSKPRPEPRRSRFLRLAVRMAALVSVGSILLASACTYVGWTREKRRLRQEAKSDPHLGLTRELAPEDCLQLAGRVEIPAGWTTPLLVAAIAGQGADRELVASREVLPQTTFYMLLLPTGSYDLLVLSDRDGNGFYETHEVVGGTQPGSPVEVATSAAPDGFIVRGPDLAAGSGGPAAPGLPLRIRRTPRANVVGSLDDEIFDPRLGEEGMYRPTRFIAATQGMMFALEPFDPGRTTVLLVHGIAGTPRDFRTLAGGLDRSRFQPLFFYYPSGLPLDKLGTLLAKAVGILGTDPAFKAPRLVVVAHSMGGLVSRRALNELCAQGRPAYLKGFVSFSAPYGGMDVAVFAVKHASEIVPSWRDVATGSPFLSRLHETPLPSDLPFHLFFGWGNKSDSGPSPAGDGAVRVRSQLDPRAQKAATRTYGFEESHVGILDNAEAGRILYDLLDAFARL